MGLDKKFSNDNKKYNIVQLQFYLKGYLNVTPLCDVLRSSHTETKKKGGSHKVIHILIRLALYPFTVQNINYVRVNTVFQIRNQIRRHIHALIDNVIEHIFNYFTKKRYHHLYLSKCHTSVFL
jgi:hypothetical protein